jgi:hypothetical protein
VQLLAVLVIPAWSIVPLAALVVIGLALRSTPERSAAATTAGKLADKRAAICRTYPRLQSCR